MNKLKYLILLTIVFVACQRPDYTIYLAGDSTMANKKPEKSPETGWGMELQSFFNDNVTVSNHAKNGRSSLSFVSEGRWDSIMNALQPGDYVFIEFGHNDQKRDSARHSSPEEYYERLCQFVDDVKSKNGNPVLFTPIVRRRFNEEGKFYDTHGKYPAKVKLAAKEKKVPFIDLHKRSEELLKNLGEEESKSLFLIADSGVWENYPSGVDDNTHLNKKGAKEIAHLAVQELIELGLELQKDVK